MPTCPSVTVQFFLCPSDQCDSQQSRFCRDAAMGQCTVGSVSDWNSGQCIVFPGYIASVTVYSLQFINFDDYENKLQISVLPTALGRYVNLRTEDL